jgi:arsenate reductase
MAEGLCRNLRGDEIDAYSAGMEAHGLNPLAVRAMGEIGIDISGHRSKTVTDLLAVEFDYVVTVCGHADETCPVFPARTAVVHRGFDDPPKLATGAQSDAEALSCYRRVRDEIRTYVLTLPGALQKK